MMFVVTIHEAQTNNQNFGMVKNAYIRILNKGNNQELCKYNLNNEFDDVDSVQIARIYKYDNEWHFEALAGGYSGGLGALLEIYN
jgi:tellurium resistance protein TerD